LIRSLIRIFTADRPENSHQVEVLYGMPPIRTIFAHGYYSFQNLRKLSASDPGHRRFEPPPNLVSSKSNADCCHRFFVWQSESYGTEFLTRVLKMLPKATKLQRNFNTSIKLNTTQSNKNYVIDKLKSDLLPTSCRPQPTSTNLNSRQPRQPL